MEDVIIKKIIKNSFQSNVSEILQPFSDKFKINYFRFFRHYEDGSFINLNSNSEWSDLFYRNNFHEIAWFDKTNPKSLNSGEVLWGTKAQSDDNIVGKTSREKFNFHHGVTIINKSENCCDFFDFTVPKHDKSFNNDMITQRHLLFKFTFYFLEKSASLIAEAEKNKIKIQRSFISSHEEKRNNLKITRFYIPGTNNYLTLKEAEVLYYFSEGYTSATIANKLFNSKRTIEQHAKNILIKLNCRKIVEAVSKMAKLGILDKNIIGIV